MNVPSEFKDSSVEGMVRTVSKVQYGVLKSTDVLKKVTRQ